MTQWKIDRWKFYDIIHREQAVCNPTSIEKLKELYALLRLPRGTRVLDIACGKAEMLVMLAEMYGIEGVGVELSPYWIKDAENRREARVPNADLKFLHMDGAEYRPDAPESFDLTLCIGASGVFGGHRGTLRALRDMTRPGGFVMVGEPYWVKKPMQDYLTLEGISEETFTTHYGNVAIGEDEGLTILHSIVSSQDDWDRYEGLHWLAAAEYVQLYPKDPDVPEIMERTRIYRDSYLRWGRDTLGWAIYLFRK